jgi:hypothetical protein
LWANANTKTSSFEITISSLLKRNDLLDVDAEAPQAIKRIIRVSSLEVENATFS